jgi:cell division protein FtsQ
MSRRSQKKQVTKASRLSKVTIGFKALLLVTALLVMLSWAKTQIVNPAVMPVRTVKVDGEIHYLKKEHLKQVVAQAVNGNFFTLDLPRMRKQIEQLPWVANVSVRRVWPDTLRVWVREQVPLAYWGDDAMLNQDGEIFRPERLPHLEDLVTLECETQQTKGIIRDYQRMETLLNTIGLKLTHLWVDARQAWRLQINHRLMIQLGRRDVIPKLTRFVQLYPVLVNQEEGRQVMAVDLRYTNGFAVRWQADPAEAQTRHQTTMRQDSLSGMSWNNLLRNRAGTAGNRHG